MHLERLIDAALDILRQGEPIPLDLAADLMAEGVDVQALEDSVR